MSIIFKIVRSQPAVFLLLLFNLQGFASDITGSGPNQINDTSFVELAGSVKDSDTKDPIVFAHIILTGTNIGTVSNTDGRFLLKIPHDRMDGQITVSSLGYKNLTMGISDLQRINNEIQLEMMRYEIKELVVRQLHPIDLLREAKQKIPLNYGETPAMFTAFYRETIKQNRNYVAVSEAVFDVYKASYGTYGEEDRIKVFKGRKSQDVNRMDTVLFKLQGGPYNLFILDVAKHFDEIFADDCMDYYDFHLNGQVSIQDREAYQISFSQKDNVQLPLYDGFVYLDVQTLAIISLKFNLSPVGIEYAPASMILKKPIGMRVEIPGADYLVKFSYSKGRWFLSYARSEARFRCKWNRKLFRSNYVTVSEMAVTDVDLQNIVKFRMRESSRPGDIFSEVVSDFEDPQFWGDYNIIRPEISIEEATRKLSRKLQRK